MSDRQMTTCRACGGSLKIQTHFDTGVADCEYASCLEISSLKISDLDKKVLYLDQAAISEIFKIRTGTMGEAAAEMERLAV